MCIDSDLHCGQHGVGIRSTYRNRLLPAGANKSLTCNACFLLSTPQLAGSFRVSDALAQSVADIVPTDDQAVKFTAPCCCGLTLDRMLASLLCWADYQPTS